MKKFESNLTKVLALVTVWAWMLLAGIELYQGHVWEGFKSLCVAVFALYIGKLLIYSTKEKGRCKV